MVQRSVPGSSSSAPISRLGCVGKPVSAGSSKLIGSHEADTSEDDLSSIAAKGESRGSKAYAVV
jgi:hypothetical protein